MPTHDQQGCCGVHFRPAVTASRPRCDGVVQVAVFAVDFGVPFLSDKPVSLSVHVTPHKGIEDSAVPVALAQFC